MRHAGAFADVAAAPGFRCLRGAIEAAATSSRSAARTSFDASEVRLRLGLEEAEALLDWLSMPQRCD